MRDVPAIDGGEDGRATIIRKGYAETGQGQVHYRTCGNDGIPLVLLHQNAATSLSYETLMHAMPASRRILAFDTPGFGESFVFTGNPSMDDYADILAEALANIGIGRVHFFGHHAGSILALNLADRYPELCESVTLSAPACLTEEERRMFSEHFGNPIPVEADGRHLVRCWEYVGALGAGRDLEIQNRDAIETARSAAGRVQNYRALWAEDYSARLARTKVPVHLLCSEQDALWPFFERARSIRPEAPWALVQGGNFSADFDGQGLARAISAFVELVDSTSLAKQGN